MKISIITTTYNSASTIEQTFRSVLAQGYDDLEYIVVDGASIDGTIDVIKAYEVLFGGRMRWISESDRGIYDAMNKGLLMCTGDVVGVLNSDDYYTSNDILATIADTFAADETLDAVYADVHFIKEGKPDKCVRYYSSAIFSPWKLRFGYMPAHPSFYCRRTVYDACGLFSLDYKIAADYDMMVRMFYNKGIKAKYIKKDFVTMRTGGISTGSIKHRLLISKEDVKACRNNGMYTNMAFICVKYFTKIFEFL